MSDPVTAAVAASATTGTAVSVPVATGFFATLGAFIAGWAILILLGLLVLAIFSEHSDSRGWSVFFTIIAGIVAYISFSVSWTILVAYVGTYLVIGLIWSFWRYKRHAEKIVEEFRNADPREKEHALIRLHPKEMLSTITAWILVWPASFIENMVGDLINFIQMMVTKFFRGIYHRIYDAAVAALK